MITLLINFYLAFLFYGFIGWFYESNIWAPLELKRFTNRGFLIGPLCPIYGLVANMDYYALCWIKNPVLIFFAAIIICCFFEYIVSWSFEKFFGKKWWDYSNYPFNLHGRISVYSGFFFGVAGLLLVKVIHPFTMNVIDSIPWTTRWILALVLGIIQFLDIILASILNKSTNEKIVNINNKITKITDFPFDVLNKIKTKSDSTKFGEAKKRLSDNISALNQKIIIFENTHLKKNKKSTEETAE